VARGPATTIRQRKPNWTDSEGRPPEGLSPRMGEIKWSFRSGEQTKKLPPKEVSTALSINSFPFSKRLIINEGYNI